MKPPEQLVSLWQQRDKRSVKFDPKNTVKRRH